MLSLNISYCKFNSALMHLESNQAFLKLFCTPHKSAKKRLIYHLLGSNPDIKFRIRQMPIGEQQSFILFTNNNILFKDTPKNTTLVLYAVIDKHHDGYLIRIVNWLNWLHSLNHSLEHNYRFISNFNTSNYKPKFHKIADAACYKAFYPLISHIPQKLAGGINNSTLFDIMHLFIKRRGEYKYSKDYARNIYSRIRTNLRKEFDLDNHDVLDVIKNEQLLNINLNGEMQIPHTVLTQNIAIAVDHDPLLLSLIETLCPQQ